MAQEISAEQSGRRVLQLASCNLSTVSENDPVMVRAESAPAA
jgi:hypothetical protein